MASTGNQQQTSRFWWVSPVFLLVLSTERPRDLGMNRLRFPSGNHRGWFFSDHSLIPREPARFKASISRSLARTIPKRGGFKGNPTRNELLVLGPLFQDTRLSGLELGRRLDCHTRRPQVLPQKVALWASVRDLGNFGGVKVKDMEQRGFCASLLEFLNFSHFLGLDHFSGKQTFF